MTLSTSDFGSFHAAVHGGKMPFAWQQRLLEQIVQEKAWPRVVDLPTGVGKTTCIDIALFALALDAENEAQARWCPRRIAMVVDRRIVVDQVAERGRSLLHTLSSSTDVIVVEVARRLRTLTRTGEEPLGVFTLRGGMPKDDGWARAPESKRGFLLNHLISELLPQREGGYRFSNSDPVTGQAAWFDLRIKIEKATPAEAGESAPRFEPIAHGTLPKAPDLSTYGAEFREKAK